MPDGAEVLVAEGEFTSVTFPFLAQAGRGVTVREVPLTALAEEVRESTYLVAVAAVQSADGRVADLDALVEACARTGTRTLRRPHPGGRLAAGRRERFDWTVTSAYKWLLAPRGTAFLTARPERWDEVVPHSAGWYAGADRWSSIYGSPLRLADGRPPLRRLPGLARLGRDRGLAGTARRRSGAAALHRHAVGLAEPLPRRRRAGAERLRDRLAGRRRRRACAAWPSTASGAPSGRAGCGSPSTCTTPTPRPTLPPRCLRGHVS